MITHISIRIVHFILFGTTFLLTQLVASRVLEEVEEWDYTHVFDLDGVHVFNLLLKSQIMFNDNVEIKQEGMSAITLLAGSASVNKDDSEF